MGPLNAPAFAKTFKSTANSPMAVAGRGITYITNCYIIFGANNSEWNVVDGEIGSRIIIHKRHFLAKCKSRDS
jgi:hypothetical protein